MLNWSATKDDYKKISAIVRRALKMPLLSDVPFTELEMDITACHCNGCPIDLDMLLNSGDFDFFHDVCGIRRHIDRETGELRNCFVPRCSAREVPA